MGLAMAAMAVPGAMAPAWAPPVFAVLFGGITAAALAGAMRGVPHGLHHALEAAAMGYMALAMATAGDVPLLTGALLLYFAGYVLRAGAALLPAAAVAGTAGTAAPPAGRVPDLSCACRLALATGTFAMLLTV